MEQSPTSAGTTTSRRHGGVAQGLAVVICQYLPMLAILALPPVLPNMLAAFRDLPQATTVVPLMIGIPGLVVALLSWFAGAAVDRFGRRGPLLWSIVLYTVVGVIPVLFPNFVAVVISRLGIGVAQSMIMVASSALLIDYFSDAQRRTWLTVQGVFNAVAAPLTAVLGGLAGAHDWKYAFLLYAFGLPILLITYLCCYEPDTSSQRGVSAAPTAPFPAHLAGLVGGVALFSSIYFFVFVIHGGLVFKAVGVESSTELGRLIGLTTLGAPLGVVFFNFASRRLSLSTLLGVMVLIMAVGTIGIGLSTSREMMLACGFLQQTGGGLAIPVLVMWAAHLFAPEHRGRGFGIFNGAFFFGQFFCALVLNAAEAITGGVMPAMAALGVVGVIGAGVVTIVSKPRKAPAAVEEALG